MTPHPSGRAYIPAYDRVRRRDAHNFFEQAVTASGGTVLYRSADSVAPAFFTIADGQGDRTGVVAYVFMASRIETTHRPLNEWKGQIRYGDVNDASWRLAHHPVAFDPTGADLTVVLIAAPQAGLFVALDPRLYDPLPMGISVFWKDDETGRAQRGGWHAFGRYNIEGARREARSPTGVETLVAFAPERLFDYLRLEREAQALSLDPALRLAAARRVGRRRTRASSAPSVHELEREYGLTAREILDLIGERGRVAMAVRGGVAEHHLGMQLAADPHVIDVRPGMQEGPPDFCVTLRDGTQVSVECKNASPKILKRDPTPRVEVQKTRISRDDPASRLYPVAAFDVLAACMYGRTGRWEFRYARTAALKRDDRFPDRVYYLQPIDGWHDSLFAALGG